MRHLEIHQTLERSGTIIHQLPGSVRISKEIKAIVEEVAELSLSVPFFAVRSHLDGCFTGACIAWSEQGEETPLHSRTSIILVVMKIICAGRAFAQIIIFLMSSSITCISGMGLIPQTTAVCQADLVACHTLLSGPPTVHSSCAWSPYAAWFPSKKLQ